MSQFFKNRQKSTYNCTVNVTSGVGLNNVFIEYKYKSAARQWQKGEDGAKCHEKIITKSIMNSVAAAAWCGEDHVQRSINRSGLSNSPPPSHLHSPPPVSIVKCQTLIRTRCALFNYFRSSFYNSKIILTHSECNPTGTRTRPDPPSLKSILHLHLCHDKVSSFRFELGRYLYYLSH